MNQRMLQVVAAIVVAGVLLVAGFGFAYQIYISQENCQQMDSQRGISADCWAFPNKLLVVGGTLLGLIGTGLLAGSILWYRSNTG